MFFRLPARHALGLLVLWPGAVWSQEVEMAGEFRQFGRIEITGSSIIRKEVKQSLPVQIIARKDIQNSQARNLEDLLQTHPAMLYFSQRSNLGLTRAGYASAALHGMPTGTLVLLNGQRLATYPRQTIITQERSGVELAQIPLSAVDRIELLTDGASSLYGTDAIAGVVNIITQTERQQWEVSAQTFIPDHQRGLGRSAQLSGGQGSLLRDGMNWTVNLEVEQQDALLGQDRPYASRGRYRFVHEGRTLEVDGGLLTPAQSVPTLSSSTAPPYNRLWNALYANGQCPAPYVPDRTQPACLYNPYADMSLYPRQDMVRLHSQMQWQTDVGVAYAELLHSQVDQERKAGRWDTYISRIGSSASDPGQSLALAQGFTPGQSFLLWRPSELGALGQFYQDQYTRLRAGLKGEWEGWDFQLGAMLADGAGRWSDELATYPNLGRSTDSQRVLTQDTLLQSLNAGTPSSEQLKALLLSLLQRRLIDRGMTQTRSLSLNASKAVAEHQGQDVLLGWGTEWRSQHDRYTPGASMQPAFDASRQIWAQYAELILPVALNAEITAAARHDHYSDFGHTTNAKLAGKWQISDRWMLRGSMGSGFRAPTLGQMSETEVYSSAFVVHPGCNAVLQQITAQLSQTLGRPGQCIDSDGRLWLSGRGSRSLQPETSLQQSLGVRVSPSANHSLSVDYWRIRMSHTITQFPGTLVLADPLGHLENFTLDKNGRLDLFAPLVNIGSSDKSGLDMSWLLRAPLEQGRLFFRFDTSRYLKSVQTLSAGMPPTSNLGRFSDASSTVTPRWQSRWTAGFEHAQGAVSATLNHVSGYTGEAFSATDVLTGQTVRVTNQQIPAFWTVDVQTHYRLHDRFTLKAGIGNLLNRQAPLSFTQNLSTIMGVNTNLSQLWGRTVTLGLTARF